MFCKVLNMTFLWTFILGSFFQETNKVNLLNVWNLITLNEHISIFRQVDGSGRGMVYGGEISET